MSPFLNVAPLIFLVELNGNKVFAINSLLYPKYVANARDVILLSSSAVSIEPIIAFSELAYALLISTLFTTFIVPSVIVPVLSRHSTSVRASISIEYKSCTSVLLLASLITPTASATLVSKNMPAGIMPIIEPAVCLTASTVD